MAEPDYAALKEGTKALWSLGDYSQIEKFTVAASHALIDACAVSAGQEVLDVAAGTGNFALLAAAEGASVVASDLTPHLIERGKERTAEEGVEIEWVEADAEELPFDDERFDCTASVFGAMFAPRPDRAAEELFRVTRPGNTVGMANWAPEGVHRAGCSSSSTTSCRALRACRHRSSGGARTSCGSASTGSRARSSWSAGRRRSSSTRSMRSIGFMENAGPQVAAKQALGPELYDETSCGGSGTSSPSSTRQKTARSASRAEYLLVVARKRG